MLAMDGIDQNRQGQTAPYSFSVSLHLNEVIITGWHYALRNT